MPGTWIAESLLGILFGVVAVMQMNAPFEPIPGLIIDMRNVPMVLAGAFLGARGMLLCMVLAIAARLQIGGIGALAGVASILIAGAAGAFWNAATARRIWMEISRCLLETSVWSVDVAAGLGIVR